MSFRLRIVSSARPVPVEYRRNFFHLYFDIAWFGVLNCSTISFLAVYATRLGATPQQVGLITAAPALINILLTMPVGMWLQNKNILNITPRFAAITRIFYLFLVPLAWLLPPTGQIWAVILITLLMNIPGTINAVAGNAFFAEIVPPDWRAHVVGIRNALLAAASVITALLVGFILRSMPFPTGYQVVFFIGFIGAALSSLHLFLIKPIPPHRLPAGDIPPPPVSAPSRPRIRLDILKGKYGKVIFFLFLFQLSIITAGPLFPIYQVRNLHFTDQTISLGTSVFWFVHFLAATQTSALSRKFNFKTLTALGALFTAMSFSIFLFSYTLPVYLLCQLISGTAWALIGGGQINYLLENVPPDDRPAHLAWYNLLLNAATLIGSLLGPAIAGVTGLFWAIVIVIAFRVFVSAIMLKWG